MVNFGRIFRENYGDRRFNTVDLTKMDKRKLREIKTRVRHRKALDFYGKKYNSLNTEQKRFINAKAQRLIEQGAEE